MSEYVVIEHVKDPTPDLFAGTEDPIREDGTIDHGEKLPGGVYRLIVGIPVYEDVPVDAVIDPTPDGEDPVIEEARTERLLVGYEDAREFVFAEADERWQGKRSGEVAAAQRRLVREALQPAEPRQTDNANVEPMPGIGGAL